MGLESLYSFMNGKMEIIHKVTRRLHIKNLDYDYHEIKNMVLTAIFESENEPTSHQLYLMVLHRILEEKGYQYKGNELLKISVNVEDSQQLENHCDKKEPKEINATEVLNDLFCSANLTQEEVFVMALSQGLDTPPCLGGEYKKILDHISLEYYIRPLTKKEIAAIMRMSVAKIDKLKSTAMKKIQDCRCNREF